MKYINRTIESSVDITVKCPLGHEASIDPIDIRSDHNECDLCGSHGDVEFHWECKECKKGYIYTLQSW